MRKPKKVRIIANINGDESFDKYIGSEHQVIEYDIRTNTVIIPIPDPYVDELTSEWIMDEYKVIAWEDDETVTISKTEYDELLEFKFMYEELDK